MIVLTDLLAKDISSADSVDNWQRASCLGLSRGNERQNPVKNDKGPRVKPNLTRRP